MTDTRRAEERLREGLDSIAFDMTPTFVIDDIRTVLSTIGRLREARDGYHAAANNYIERIERLEGVLRRVVDGIDNWNRGVEKIIGREVDYAWGALDEARTALAAGEQAEQPTCGTCGGSPCECCRTCYGDKNSYYDSRPSEQQWVHGRCPDCAGEGDS